MTSLAVDGLCEEDFRRSIENRLREGKPQQALERLRRLIAPFAGAGRPLPKRFASVSADELVLLGWDGLGEAIARHDKPDRPITALSIAFGWPGEELPAPDPQGRLKPCLETGYFTDDSYPFSQSGRDDLLEGYSYHGCTWAADHEATDTTLGLAGIDDLHGALAALEQRLLASDTPDPDELLAGSLAACLLSVLLYEAVEAKIAAEGLPRPLCVTAGSNGVYPYFDAPVAGFPEEARLAAETEADELESRNAVPAPRFSSLLVVGIPRAKKRAVLVLEESETETAERVAKLRGLNHAEPPILTPAPDLPAELPASTPEPDPEFTPEFIAASPLLTKKNPGHAWDFRDLLGPRETGDPYGDAPDGPDHAPLERIVDELWTEPEGEQDDDSFDSAQAEPVDLPPPEPARFALSEDPQPEPGFISLIPNVQERLEQLLAGQVAPPLPTEPELEPDSDFAEFEQPELPVSPPVLAIESAAVSVGPYWPAGPGWFEDDAEADTSSSPALPEPAEAPHHIGLWARFRVWLSQAA